MSRAVSIIIVALAGACIVPVDIGLLDTGGSSTTDVDPPISTSGVITDSGMTTIVTLSGSSESADPPPLPEPHAFAIRFADLPDIGDSDSDTGGSSASTSASTGATSTEGGDSGSTDPDALVIRATSGLATCEDPYGNLPCPATWTYGFDLPPELQIVGATGRLEDFNGFVAETGDGEIDCSFGGGSLFGSFEISAIDGDHVAGRMFDMELTTWETEVEFDAPKC